MELFFLILGLAGLVLGAHLVIKGALNIAERYKISQFFVGLTILAIGTDLPELVVMINGSIHRVMGTETSGLMIGNILGSAMGQIALTLGIIGMFCALTLTKREIIRDGSFMVGSVLLLLFVAFDGEITRFEGAIFILIYLIYFLNLQREEKVVQKYRRAQKQHLGWALLSLAAGFGVLIYCSNAVVDNAVSLAQAWGVSQSLVGVLIIGLGTSLPEIALSVGAIRKKAAALSVGNLIGSNIFDVLLVLGLGSSISGFAVNFNLLRFDIPFLFFTSLLVIFFVTTRMKIYRVESVALLVIYLVYFAAKLFGF